MPDWADSRFVCGPVYYQRVRDGESFAASDSAAAWAYKGLDAMKFTDFKKHCKLNQMGSWAPKFEKNLSASSVTTMGEMRARATDFRLGKWLPEGVPPYTPHMVLLDKAYTFLELAHALHDAGILKVGRESLEGFSRVTSPSAITCALVKARALSEDPSFLALSKDSASPLIPGHNMGELGAEEEVVACDSLEEVVGAQSKEVSKALDSFPDALTPVVVQVRSILANQDTLVVNLKAKVESLEKDKMKLHADAEESSLRAAALEMPFSNCMKSLVEETIKKSILSMTESVSEIMVEKITELTEATSDKFSQLKVDLEASIENFKTESLEGLKDDLAPFGTLLGQFSSVLDSSNLKLLASAEALRIHLAEGKESSINKRLREVSQEEQQSDLRSRIDSRGDPSAKRPDVRALPRLSSLPTPVPPHPYSLTSSSSSNPTSTSPPPPLLLPPPSPPLSTPLPPPPPPPTHLPPPPPPSPPSLTLLLAPWVHLPLPPCPSPAPRRGTRDPSCMLRRLQEGWATPTLPPCSPCCSTGVPLPPSLTLLPPSPPLLPPPPPLPPSSHLRLLLAIPPTPLSPLPSTRPTR